MRLISVIIVSTNALVRSGIQQVVTKSDIPINVVGMFATFREVNEFMVEHHTHVVIIDDSLPRATHLAQEVKKLIARHPSLAILMIAHRPTTSLVRLLLEQGARGIMHMDDDLDRGLINAIQSISDGGLSVSPSISRLLAFQRPLPNHIQQRDIDVLQLLAEGFQAKEISAHLGLTPKSVYRILKTLHEVYDAQSNAQLIDIAHQKKLLEPIEEERRE